MKKDTSELAAGIEPLLEPGETLVAACRASVRYYQQTMAAGANFIARELVGRKLKKARASCEQAGLAVESPMAIALTSHHLLTVKVKASKWTGKVESVEGVLGRVPIGDVQGIEVKRFGGNRRITVTIGGVDALLEGNAAASELGEAFAAAS